MAINENIIQNNKHAIVIKDLKKSYKKLEVLKGISFKVRKGSIFALLGQNGAGKTTTINILSTLLVPDGGEAEICGFNVLTKSYNVRKSIGLTGQYAAVDDLLSGKENMEMMGRLYHLSTKQSKLRANELLNEFDLANAANRPVKTYSGGMRRRLDLAMSLIANPPVIFLDEPTTGLDPRSRLTLWKTIRDLAKSGITILLTTQYMEEAEKLADRIAVLDSGTIIAEGTVNELKMKVGNARVIVTFTDNNSFSLAKELLKDTDIRVDDEKYILTVIASSGTQKIKEIINMLEKENISIDTISLQHPTLDDVFLKLTEQKRTWGNTDAEII